MSEWKASMHLLAYGWTGVKASLKYLAPLMMALPQAEDLTLQLPDAIVSVFHWMQQREAAWELLVA